MKSNEGGCATPIARAQIDIADLHVNLRDRTVRRGSLRLPVSARSFELLRVLIERYPETAEHRELLAEVWKGRVVTPDVLSQRVRLLRKGLGDERGDDGYVASVHGLGYRLARAPVSAPDPGNRRPAGSLSLARASWIALAVALPLLLVALGSSYSHLIKHLIKHLL